MTKDANTANYNTGSNASPKYAAYYKDHADRIEQLAATCEELEAKLSESEALLAKAVEALQYMVNHAGQLERNEGIYWEATEIARTTLAELKGQDDE